jgi:hypothetical protein
VGWALGRLGRCESRARATGQGGSGWGWRRSPAPGRWWSRRSPSYRTKLIAIADAQRDGRLDAGFTPADLLALALGVAGAWFTASEALRTHDSPNPWSPQRLAQFRAAAVQATTRILGNTFPTADKTD